MLSVRKPYRIFSSQLRETPELHLSCTALSIIEFPRKTTCGEAVVTIIG